MTEKTPTKGELDYARTSLEEIKRQLRVGLLSYEAARMAAETHFKTLNIYAKQLAKVHGVRFKPLSFTAYMR